MTSTLPFRGAARAALYDDSAPQPPFVSTSLDAPGRHETVSDRHFEDRIDIAKEATPTIEEPVDLQTLGAAGSPTTATMGLRGLAARVGLKFAPSAAELAYLELAARRADAESTIRQTTWRRAVGILVANRKGGVGKTPTSILIGGTLAAIRGGSVAVMEVADDPGTLTFRAEGNPARGIGELVTDADQVQSAGQLASYTAPQTSFASVIGTVGRRRELTGDDVTRTAALIDRYYAIRVMDSGNQPTSSAFQGALGVTDALVIPILNTAEAALEAIDLLGLLRHDDRYSHLADSATILRLTDGRPENAEVLDRLDASLRQHRVGQIFEIPLDAHIAERGPITLDRLHPTTRTAVTFAAAGIVNALRHTPIH